MNGWLPVRNIGGKDTVGDVFKVLKEILKKPVNKEFYIQQDHYSKMKVN